MKKDPEYIKVLDTMLDGLFFAPMEIVGTPAEFEGKVIILLEARELLIEHAHRGEYIDYSNLEKIFVNNYYEYLRDVLENDFNTDLAGYLQSVGRLNELKPILANFRKIIACSNN